MTNEQPYAAKEQRYFTGDRRDIIDRLSPDPKRRILEIGCGDGTTGAYAKKTGKCGAYIGIELYAPAANLASKVLDEVHVANVEDFEFQYPEHHFDVLVASEVLEHLIDPWTLLRRVHTFLKIGGCVYASSPNIAHFSTLQMLLKGRWDLDSSGRMDRTHLRWFTPASYADMFEQTGYTVVSAEPIRRPGPRARTINLLTFGKFSHLFVSQIFITAIVRGNNSAPSDAMRIPATDRS